MDVFQGALLAAAIAAALLSWNNPRGLAWIAVAAVDFVLCAFYQAAEPAVLPYPMFTGLVDATVCLVLYLVGRFRWEMWLFRIFQLSVLFSVLRLFGIIETTYLYVAMLELANWLALLVIGGTSLLRHVNGMGLLGFASRWRVHRLNRAFFSKRAHPPFGG